ncbi:MAG: GNAT family N-acetyltransferase [Bacillota bacterium]|nr:GNAT family N-acetyltransferase [Bacillota bacterium]
MFLKLDESQYSMAEDLFYYGGLESVFAFAVTEKKIPGRIFVDDTEEPKSALICSFQGKYLVTGDESNSAFNSSVAEFLLNPDNHIEFYDLYASSEEWIEVLSGFLNGQAVILRFTVYHSNNIQNLPAAESSLPAEDDLELKQIDEALFNQIVNEFYPSYKNLWADAGSFCSNSFGFCIVKGSELLSVAASRYTGGGYAEIDIETSPYYYRKGFAFNLGRQFIEYCRNSGLTALWICDSKNKASHALAQKLGFTKSKEVEMLWWHQSRGAMNGYLNKFGY